MESNQLQTFSNPNIGEIRGFIKDGDPWFLAGQVCRTLGIKNASDAVNSIKERYEIAGIKDIGSSYTLIKTSGGTQKVLIICESYLYELIFQSRKRKAIKFRSWVTREVLPALRKYGMYRMEGKLIRKDLTESITYSGENERQHGHGFSNYSKLINKSLDLPTKNDRNNLSPEILEKIAHRENLVTALISEGKIYNEIKAILEGLK